MVLGTAEQCGGPGGTSCLHLHGGAEPGGHERPQSKSSLFSPLGFAWSFACCLRHDLHVSTSPISSLPCAGYGVAHWGGPSYLVTCKHGLPKLPW